MQIKDVMTKDVASVFADDSVQRAAKLMNEYNIGSVPVISNEKVVGIITDRDITLRCVAKGEDTKNIPVRDVMTSNPVTGAPTMDVHDAARIMSERQIRRLPVVDNNNLVGMVALGDLAVEPNLTDDAAEALKDISIPASPDML
jgi:CBS domain-containing protein